jgi:hypothetical protein
VAVAREYRLLQRLKAVMAVYIQDENVKILATLSSHK